MLRASWDGGSDTGAGGDEEHVGGFFVDEHDVGVLREELGDLESGLDFPDGDEPYAIME